MDGTGLTVRAVVVCAMAGPAALADTLHVPGNYTAIQAAIDAAVDGDVVMLADGTYTGPGNRDLDLAGKAITVRSASGDPALCVIDCQGEGRGFCFRSGEGPDSVVEGLTITNGYVDVDSPGGDEGGGVLCTNGSSPTLSNCAISGNQASLLEYGVGGGLACRESGNPTLTGCEIRGNWADYGGGLYCHCSSPTFAGCEIDSNTAAWFGGAGDLNEHSAPAFLGCTLDGNVSFMGGGGLNCWSHSSPTLTHCVLRGNRCGESMYGSGGAISCSYSSNATATNCILWDNTPNEIEVYSSAPVVTYCDVQGGWPGAGNIDVDPHFAFADDRHLLASSPCIDAGSNDPPLGLPDDPDGNPRPLDGDGDGTATADIGLYEFNPEGPSIALSADNFEFYAIAGEGEPADQMLLVRNCGGGTLAWTVTGQPAWLDTSPASGASSGEVAEVLLHVETAGLPHGTHAAMLEVNDAEAINSSRPVWVTLHVGTVL